MNRILRASTQDPLKFMPIWSHDVIDCMDSGDILYYHDCFSSQSLQEIISYHTQPAAVICDHESSIKPHSVPIFYIPCLHYVYPRLQKILLDQKNNWVDKIPTTLHCFNFSVNRKTLDRYLMLKLLEWFDLDNCTYTWSGHGSSMNCQPAVQEMDRLEKDWLTSEFRCHVLSPIKEISPRWYQAPDVIQDNSLNGSLPGVRNYNGVLEHRWNYLKHIYHDSAVSLITEGTENNEPNFTFTEKTFWAVLGLNFPIWVGNYGQAEQMQNMGFDIFADVINHDYQYGETLIERCYHAIADNLDVLRDHDLARHLRNINAQRLLHNRNHLIVSGISDWDKAQIHKLPIWAQQSIGQTEWITL